MIHLNRISQYLDPVPDIGDIMAQRVARSNEMLAAAASLAIEHKLTFWRDAYRVIVADEKLRCIFFPAQNRVVRINHLARQLEPLEITAEIDCYDFVALFVEGKFHP